MNKLIAIVRYELLMAWRRRSLPILWLLLLTGIVGFSLLITSVNHNGMSLAEIIGRNANLPAYIVNTIPLINVVIAGVMIYGVGVTMMLAETIPLDRQFKVRELLNALPISRASYLGGKLLGVWSGLILGWLLIGLVCPIALYLIFGPYDLRVIALLWVIALLPTTLMASAFTVLACAFVGSRRQAVLISLLALPVVMILIAGGLPAFLDAGGLIDPIYAMAISPQALTAPIIDEIVRALLLYAGAILVMWTFVWAAMRLREAR